MNNLLNILNCVWLTNRCIFNSLQICSHSHASEIIADVRSCACAMQFLKVKPKILTLIIFTAIEFVSFPSVLLDDSPASVCKSC